MPANKSATLYNSTYCVSPSSNLPISPSTNSTRIVSSPQHPSFLPLGSLSMLEKHLNNIIAGKYA